MTKKIKLFQVVFEGNLTGEYELDDAKARFGRLFKLNPSTLDKLFSGKTYVIKKEITEPDAIQYAIRVAETGCECYIETVPRQEDSPLKENRKNDERRLRFRRPPRPGAIVPDRRLLIRRSDDVDLFEELHARHKEIPMGFSSYSWNEGDK